MNEPTVTARARALLAAWRAELHRSNVVHGVTPVTYGDPDIARDIAELDEVIADLAAPQAEPVAWLRCEFCHQLGCANPVDLAARIARKQQADPKLAGPGVSAHERFLLAELARLQGAVLAATREPPAPAVPAFPVVFDSPRDRDALESELRRQLAKLDCEYRALSRPIVQALIAIENTRHIPPLVAWAQTHFAAPRPSAQPAEPKSDTAPWPVVDSYSGGGSAEGARARVWIRFGDGPETVEFVPAEPKERKPADNDWGNQRCDDGGM